MGKDCCSSKPAPEVKTACAAAEMTVRRDMPVPVNTAGSCGSDNDSGESETTLALSIAGMTCADCSLMIENTLAKTTGVKSMQVSSMTGQVRHTT